MREHKAFSNVCGSSLGSRQALAWPSMGIHQGLDKTDDGGGQGKQIIDVAVLCHTRDS